MLNSQEEIPSAAEAADHAAPAGRAPRALPWKSTLAILITGWIVIELISLPFGEIRSLRDRNPGETEFMRLDAERARDAGRPFRKSQTWVRLRDISPDLVNAVIVAEDGRFWSHGGFDWFEFRESVLANIMRGRAARGASTITQQLVKNLYLSPSKNPIRKLREWVLTWWMERTLSKARILEIYLNVIELGNGVYGVQAASVEYFGKDASILTRDESARLASIIPSPKRHRPEETSRYVARRSAIILDRMAARGM